MEKYYLILNNIVSDTPSRFPLMSSSRVKTNLTIKCLCVHPLWSLEPGLLCNVTGRSAPVQLHLPFNNAVLRSIILFFCADSVRPNLHLSKRTQTNFVKQKLQAWLTRLRAGPRRRSATTMTVWDIPSVGMKSIWQANVSRLANLVSRCCWWMYVASKLAANVNVIDWMASMVLSSVTLHVSRLKQACSLSYINLERASESVQFDVK